MSSSSALPASRKSFDYEGILEVLKEPAKGYRDFCGVKIELRFKHVSETEFHFVGDA
jgi:hypothetical protein